MQMTVKGVLQRKKDTEIVSTEFKKREFVVKTDEQHPQTLVFQLVNDKVGLIDNVNVDQNISVTFDLRGKEYKKEGEEPKVFITLQAWKIEV